MKVLAFGSTDRRNFSTGQLLDRMARDGLDVSAMRASARPIVSVPTSGDPPSLADPRSNVLITLRCVPPASRAGVKESLSGALLNATVLAVEEATHLAGARNGVCRIGLVRRTPDRSRPDFWDYWQHQHVPLVLAVPVLFTDYTTNLVIDEGCQVDGVVEQWFPDATTAREHGRRTIEERPAVLEDAQRFVSSFQGFAADGTDSPA